jgi:selenocysteine lyase/cysteine desulfurase
MINLEFRLVVVAVALAHTGIFIACRPRNLHKLIDEISLGDLIRKPGWIRMSIHPTTTTTEIEFVCNGIKALAENHKSWALDYEYNRN